MNEHGDPNPHLILSVGSQVVTLAEARGDDGRALHGRGTVGVIVQAPTDYWHSYRVRFADGLECGFRRQELALLAQFKRGEAGGPHPLREYNLHQHVIYRCVIGSRAYGLDHAESDVDRRGVYLPPADLHWSLYGVPEQLENPETQECYWEFQKFLILALKANPNILECLYTPLVEEATDLAAELLAMRRSFLSKVLYQTYNGYVLSQFKKLEADLRNRGQVKWKHAMHLIRLLLSGIGALREQAVPVRVEAHRDRLLDIRHGRASWEEVEAWRLELHREFEEAYQRTELPERPDYARANALLIRARRSMAHGGGG